MHSARLNVVLTKLKLARSSYPFILCITLPIEKNLRKYGDTLSDPARTDTHTAGHTREDMYVLIWIEGRSRTKSFYLKSYGIIVALYWQYLGTPLYLSITHTGKAG